MMAEISDEGLRFLILGCMRSVPDMEAFPIKVREVRENYDEEGTVQSFTIVTGSGLQFTVKCEFEGQVPDDRDSAGAH
jgi:hypothetical protein